MRTEAQQEASRRNGALSRGPVTADGKAISSRNAEKHGMTGHSVVLRNESREEFDRMLDDYTAEFQPRTRRETDLVKDLVVARWRLNRIHSLETAAIDFATDDQRAELSAGFLTIDEGTRSSKAFDALSETKSFANYGRYEARLMRAVQLAESRLKILSDRNRNAEANSQT
jgi:hypothetical protein